MVAALALPLATFFRALAVGMLDAEVSGPPVLGWLLRGFMLCILGGIGFWLGGLGLHVIRARPSPPSAADALVRRALGNEGRGPAMPAWITTVLVLSVGAGLLCLAGFLTIGPVLEGERRAWAVTAFVSLALLIGLVGAGIVWAGLLAIAADVRPWVARAAAFLRGIDDGPVDRPSS